MGDTLSAAPDSTTVIMPVDADAQEYIRDRFSVTPSAEQERNTFTLPAGSDLRVLLLSVPRHVRGDEDPLDVYYPTRDSMQRVRVDEDPFGIGYISETAAWEDKQRRADNALVDRIRRTNLANPSGALAEIVVFDLLRRLSGDIAAIAATRGFEARLAEAIDSAETPPFFPQQGKEVP